MPRSATNPVAAGLVLLVGKATCSWMPPQPAGAIQSYYMTGDL